MYKTLQLSLISDSEEKQKYRIDTLQALKDKLTLIYPNCLLEWYRNSTLTYKKYSYIS